MIIVACNTLGVGVVWVSCLNSSSQIIIEEIIPNIVDRATVICVVREKSVVVMRLERSGSLLIKNGSIVISGIIMQLMFAANKLSID